MGVTALGGALAAGAMAVAPTGAMARDRGFDVGPVHVDVELGHRHRHEERVEVPPPPPPAYPGREVRVWVEPVYRTVAEQEWVPAVYRTVYDRVWVPGRYEIDPYDHGRRGEHRWRHEGRFVPGHYEDIPRQELVTPGHYETVTRQELVTPGHYETRIEPAPIVVAPR